MYRFEISWEEFNTAAGFNLTYRKAFTSEDRYHKFLKKLLKRPNISNIRRIEDGRLI